ncbi:10478_t:CDS:2, partial [Racocetra persica]
VAATLCSSQNSQIRKEGDYLNKLRLNSEEFNIIKLLAPFEEITRKASGAKYPMINLIYPYMYLLKRRFAPTGGNTIDSYMDLIYGPISSEDTDETNDIDSNTDSSAEDSASTSGTYQRSKKTYSKIRKNNNKAKHNSCKRKREYRRGRGRGRGRKQEPRREYDHNYSYDSQQESEYNQDFTGLVEKFQAAIYLSLDELWNVPDEIALLATILDPRLKGLRFVNQNERINIQEKLRVKYEELSYNLR